MKSLFHVVHIFLKSATNLFCPYPEILHNELTFIYLKFDYNKKQGGQNSRNICCKCLVRNANPREIQEHNKRQERVLPNCKLTETQLKQTAFAVEGTQHKENTHISSMENGAGAATQQLQILFSLLFPHLF